MISAQRGISSTERLDLANTQFTKLYNVVSRSPECELPEDGRQQHFLLHQGKPGHEAGLTLGKPHFWPMQFLGPAEKGR